MFAWRSIPSRLRVQRAIAVAGERANPTQRCPKSFTQGISRRVLYSTRPMPGRRYNFRPEQKMQRHTDDAKREDHLPSTRTQPECRLLASLDSPQHVVREHREAQQRSQLVEVRVVPFSDLSVPLSYSVGGE